LFLDDTDRRRFLGAVGELPERFGLELHAFVLMANHYHLLVRTAEANLSQAIRWLNVTYAVKFNWAHRWRGTVFQGRFKSILIQEQGKALEVARYIHLNPVRIGGLGLNKSEQRRARVLGCENPGQELVRRRLGALREHRWSSWRIYAGAEPNPGWLETGVIGTGCGGRSRAERLAALKAFTEQPIVQGVLSSPWEGLVGGAVLGDREYAQRLLSQGKVNEQEQSAARRLRRRAQWEEVVRVAEKIRGEGWDKWAERHGDWGRDGAMYVGVRHGGLGLSEVARRVGMKYQAAAQGLKRFGQALNKDPERSRFVSKLKHQLSTI
jgi:REP element-mobilizing transposase RayT